jgi:predicted metal-dependent enzyme (double-stranded beta helix superfamily)
MRNSDFNLAELIVVARSYPLVLAQLPRQFDSEPYSRIPIFRDEHLEIVIICFADGQTSSVHDHQGSNCVIRVVQGKILESLFSRESHQLCIEETRYLLPGDVSGLDGEQIHQLSNLDKTGSILINFYSPPFKMSRKDPVPERPELALGRMDLSVGYVPG